MLSTQQGTFQPNSWVADLIHIPIQLMLKSIPSSFWWFIVTHCGRDYSIWCCMRHWLACFWSWKFASGWIVTGREWGYTSSPVMPGRENPFRGIFIVTWGWCNPSIYVWADTTTSSRSMRTHKNSRKVVRLWMQCKHRNTHFTIIINAACRSKARTVGCSQVADQEGGGNVNAVSENEEWLYCMKVLSEGIE